MFLIANAGVQVSWAAIVVALVTPMAVTRVRMNVAREIAPPSLLMKCSSPFGAGAALETERPQGPGGCGVGPDWTSSFEANLDIHLPIIIRNASFLGAGIEILMRSHFTGAECLYGGVVNTAHPA